MNFTKLFGAPAMAACMMVAIPLAASAGTITVNNATGRDNYLGSLDNMVGDLTSLSQFYLDRQGAQTTGIALI